MMKSCLVIGYGNLLRGDDGVGQLIAEAIAQQDHPNIRCLSVHQLTPELSAEMATVDVVLFVDAMVPSEPDSTVKILEIAGDSQADSPSVNLGHYANPRSLLALSETLFDHRPLAYSVLIPAIDFELGETLSPTTQQAMKIALNLIPEFVQDLRTHDHSSAIKFPCMKSA